MSNGKKKFTNVRVEYSVDTTINTGNFQNIKPGYRVSADVAEGVHPDDARKALEDLVNPWLEEAIKQYQETYG